MKTLYFTGDTKNVYDGLLLLQEKLNFRMDSDGVEVNLIETPKELKLIKKKNKIEICFSEPTHLFRMISVLFNYWNEDINLTETPQFNRIGPMIDTSRNAVMTVEKIKEVILTCSSLGLNQVMLYMEDTYEIPEYPYFGYLRGAYSYKELKEIDDFGDTLGIEVIPSIQVLAHLKNPLKWNFTREFRDTEDILLVNEPKTYDFLKAAITAASKPFRTNKIHVGMDEADKLGLGRSLQLHGLQDRFQLMNDHLTHVLEICNTLDLKVEMWSDMFFRLGSKTGDYYDPDFSISDETIAGIPEVAMVYWDYYHHKEEEYLGLITDHQLLKKEIIFAGGIWTWNGIAPNYGKTIETTHAGLSACKKANVECVYATLWGDDGAETPFDSALLGLQLFAEHQFYETVSDEHLEKQFAMYQQEDMNSFLLLDLFDQTPGVTKNNPHGSHTSKLIFYQDPLLGLYDKTISPYDLTTHYTDLANQLANCHSTKKTEKLFSFYQLFAMILANKSSLGIDMRQDYQANTLINISNYEERIKELNSDTNLLRKKHQEIWFEANKPFGWEILDIRYGGLLTRLDSTLSRLQDWQQGLSIPELEKEILPFDGPYLMPEGIVGRNLYHGIISPSKLSDV